LERLVELKKIAIESDQLGTLVTIPDWESHQCNAVCAEAVDLTQSEQQTVSNNERKTVSTVDTILEECFVLEEIKKEESVRSTQSKRYPDSFEQVYDTYPRKEGKTPGYKTYCKHIRSEADRQLLLKAIQNYRRAKSGTDACYLMHFSTFMNQWTDWLDERTGTSSLPSINVMPIALGAYNDE
jgi:hypothetical protein